MHEFRSHVSSMVLAMRKAILSIADGQVVIRMDGHQSAVRIYHHSFLGGTEVDFDDLVRAVDYHKRKVLSSIPQDRREP